MKKISLIFSYFLVLVAIGMSGWGVLGFIEYFSGQVILIPLQNATFPKGTQFIHWFLILLSGVTFLYGYFKRWKYTPNAMVTIYASLATMCFIQTFDFMERADRYTSYANEVTYYIIASFYLFKSKRMSERFRRN